jgi:hypothetical protein
LAPAGKLCGDPQQPAQTSTNGKVDVTCRDPAFWQPGCAPDGGTPTNSTLQYSSGWTPDGRALDDISIALGLSAKIWPYVAPCSAYAAAVGLAGGGGSGPAEAAFLAEHGFSCKGFNSTVAGGDIMQMRVAALDFTALVENGKIPADKLRLGPEVAQLLFLEQIRAEGYSMQQSE